MQWLRVILQKYFFLTSEIASIWQSLPINWLAKKHSKYGMLQLKFECQDEKPIAS